MADIEKSQAHITEPAVEATLPLPKAPFLARFQNRTNDPNVLGKELLQKALEFDEAQLERDAIKVRRKLDFIVVPMVCVNTCFPACLDCAKSLTPFR